MLLDEKKFNKRKNINLEKRISNFNNAFVVETINTPLQAIKIGKKLLFKNIQSI